MKKNSILYIGFILIVASMFQSCNYFEEDLSKGDYSVSLISPKDSLATGSMILTFTWDEMIEAKEYELQIVQPNFNSTEYFLVDTIITTNKFTYTFAKDGEFSWRVRAINNSSKSPFSTRKFTIDDSMDLTDEVIYVIAPRVDYTGNISVLEFKWMDIPTADEYIFSVQRDDANGDYIVEPTLLTVNNFTLDNTVAPFIEGTYYWTILAKNKLPSQTGKVTRSFTIDRTAPGTPSTIAPKNDSIVIGNTVTFRWNRYNDGAGTAVYDTLFVEQKNDLGNYVSCKKVKVSSTVTEYTETGLGVGFYKWFVQSIDVAGNASTKSIAKNFEIQ